MLNLTELKLSTRVPILISKQEHAVTDLFISHPFDP
jgi:hypothetical protein